MDVNTIYAKRREETGKRRMRAMRDQGLVPVVLYGRGGESVNLMVSEHEMGAELRQHHRVFTLQVDELEQPVYLKDVHYDPLTDRPLHIDFLRIDMEQPIKLEVELVFIGIPKGVSKGGTLVKDKSRLKVTSMPSAVPHEVEIRVTNMELEDMIRAGDVKLPEGVTLDENERNIICRI